MNPNQRVNTDNFKASLFFIPPIFIGLCLWFSVKGLSLDQYFLNVIIFLCIYVWTARFYNPDLDHRDRRPGMSSFPIGNTGMTFLKKFKSMAKNIPVINFLAFSLFYLQKSITFIWFWLWQPLTFFITHRGITHWPIIGVIFRNTYLLGLVYLFSLLSKNSFSSELFKETQNIYMLFLEPFKTKELSAQFVTYCLPIFLSDIAHSSVDALDSLRNRTAFCPPGIPRGFIASILKFGR